MKESIEPWVGCIASAMEVVGNKWTALIIRDLASGPKRFSELQRSVNLNPRTLTKRLESLASENIISLVNTENTVYKSYALTSKGEDLIPVLRKMSDWGEKYPRDPSWNVA